MWRAACVPLLAAILCLTPNSKEMTLGKQIHTDLHAASSPLLSLISCKNRNSYSFSQEDASNASNCSVDANRC